MGSQDVRLKMIKTVNTKGGKTYYIVDSSSLTLTEEDIPSVVVMSAGTLILPKADQFGSVSSANGGEMTMVTVYFFGQSDCFVGPTPGENLQFGGDIATVPFDFAGAGITKGVFVSFGSTLGTPTWMGVEATHR